jgi:hypothetical protein
VAGVAVGTLLVIAATLAVAIVVRGVEAEDDDGHRQRRGDDQQRPDGDAGHQATGARPRHRGRHARRGRALAGGHYGSNL